MRALADRHAAWFSPRVAGCGKVDQRVVVCAFAVLVVATLSRASRSGTFGLAIDDRRRCPPDREAPILA
jgi:hypothetical protein